MNISEMHAKASKLQVGNPQFDVAKAICEARGRSYWEIVPSPYVGTLNLWQMVVLEAWLMREIGALSGAS